MSVLSPGDPLFKRLREMTEQDVLGNLPLVYRALRHKEAAVRWAAASALGTAGVGVPELLERLRKERTDFVICELADSLSILNSPDSVPLLKEVSARARSPLTRAYCYLVIFEIARAAELHFLREARLRDREPLPRAQLDCALFPLGEDDALDGILAGLKSGSSEVRLWIANSLRDDRPRRKRRVIFEALEEALQSETDINARRALTKALDALRVKQRSSPPSKSKPGGKEAPSNATKAKTKRPRNR